MINKKAFTLIELLAVITIIGIIIAIAIPNVTALIYQQKIEKYKTYEKYVAIASDEFIDRYRNDFNNSDCLAVEYDTLLNEDILLEDNITCDKGIIKLIKNNNGYIKEYYLNCKDKTNDEILVSNFKNYDASTCSVTTGAFKIVNIQLNYEDNGQLYNGNWTNRNIKVSFEALNPYGNPISRYEMSFDGGKTWQDKGNTGRAVLNTEINSNVKVRAYDSLENKYSNESSFTIKIDKTKPVISLVRPNTGSNLEIYIGTDFNLVKNMTIVSSDNMSGVKRIWVTLGGKEIITVKDLAEGNYIVYYNIEDNAGNISVNANKVDLKIFYLITKYQSRVKTQVWVPPRRACGGVHYNSCPDGSSVIDYYIVCQIGDTFHAGSCDGRPGHDVRVGQCCSTTPGYYYDSYTPWTNWRVEPCSGGGDVCYSRICKGNSPEGMCIE